MILRKLCTQVHVLVTANIQTFVELSALSKVHFEIEIFLAFFRNRIKVFFKSLTLFTVYHT